MKKIILLPLLLVIASVLIIPQVTSVTESDILPACNLIDYVEDCARLDIGGGVVIYIKCSDESEVNLATCLSIWHSTTGNGAQPPECTTDADCTDGFCNTATDLCVECLDSNDCSDDDYPYCNVHKECVECLEDSDCSSGYECDSYECEPEYTGDSGVINGYYSEGPCIEDWICTSWTACIMGKKTQTCEDRNDCGTTNFKPAESMRCSPLDTATCNDGILNQGEEQVDCGGPCSPCNSCYDDKENCHSGDCETGLDCGGPCMPCTHALPIMLIIITAIIVIILIILGIWYWKIRETGELVGKTIKEFKPPIQPSSRIGI